MSESINYNEYIDDLIKNTNFEVASTNKLLTSSEYKIKTPIEVLNCLYGGGLPMNEVVHSFGDPSGGKSTLAYQTMAQFQKDYPNGMCVVLDMESSMDDQRIRFLGVDTDRVLRLPISSIESAFLSLIQMIKNKKDNKKICDLPLFIIWDTISHGIAQEGSSMSRLNAMDY